MRFKSECRLRVLSPLLVREITQPIEWNSSALYPLSTLISNFYKKQEEYRADGVDVAPEMERN